MEVHSLIWDELAGCATASFVSTRLGDNLYDAIQQPDITTFEDAIRYAFYFTDMECRMQNLMASGCTCAALIIVYDEKSQQRTLYSANIGDSRIVLYSNDGAVRLSFVRPHSRCHLGSQSRGKV